MKMKVVVIDDKPLIRRAIVETMDWQALGCEVVASAEDGLSGKMIIEKHRPDIVITDIRMPGMDGLELAEHAGTILKHFKVIVITGYEDFNFAKTCIRLGVTEYILKPLDHDELFAAVQRVALQLEQERKERSERERMLPTVKRQLISDILIGRIPPDETAGLANMDQMRANRYGVVVIRDSIVPAGDMNTAIPTGRMMPNRLFQAVEKELINESAEFYDIHLVNDLVIILLFHEASDRDVKYNMSKWGSRFKAALTQEEHHRFMIEWGAPIKKLAHLRERYLELSRKLAMRFFHSSDDVVTDEVKMSIFFDLEEFDTALDIQPADQLKKMARELLSRITAYAAGNIVVAKVLISELCLIIVKQYYKYSKSDLLLGKTADDLLDHVNRLPDMKVVGDFILAMISELKERQESKKTTYSNMVNNILHYIEENYNHDLSLNIVAERFHISAGHISRLLRKETQSSFVDIVSKTRIAAAKKLMRDPTRRIQEISEMTGFKNYIYFYQVFKKYENISPQAFKKSINK